MHPNSRNHPANYRSCIIYTELQRNTFPALKKEELLAKRASTHTSLNTHTTNQPTINKKFNSDISYAQITNNRHQSDKIQKDKVTNHSLLNQMINTIMINTKIKLLIELKKIMEKMNSMLNFVTTLVVKLI